MTMSEDRTRLILERISLEEFNEIAEGTKTEDTTREMAKLVLVNGMPGVDVAKIFEVPRQIVGIAVERIRSKHRSTFASLGLCKSTVPVPAPIIDSLGAFSEAYLKMDKDKRIEVLAKVQQLLSELSCDPSN